MTKIKKKLSVKKLNYLHGAIFTINPAPPTVAADITR